MSEFLEDFSYKYIMVFYMRNLIYVTDLFNNEGAIILASLFFKPFVCLLFILFSFIKTGFLYVLVPFLELTV